MNDRINSAKLCPRCVEYASYAFFVQHVDGVAMEICVFMRVALIICKYYYLFCSRTLGKLCDLLYPLDVLLGRRACRQHYDFVLQVGLLRAANRRPDYWLDRVEHAVVWDDS